MAQLGTLTVTLDFDAATGVLVRIRDMIRGRKGHDSEFLLVEIEAAAQEALATAALEEVVRLREERALCPWLELRLLPRGALFETREGIRAVKSEYHYPDGACQCILLESGEYAHFPDKNRTLVREVKL